MMALLCQTLTAAVQGGTEAASRWQQPTKMMAEDRPEAYLRLFEALAEANQWPQDQWASYLLPQLTGEAQAADQTLSAEEMRNYITPKTAILNRVGATPERYRRRLREGKLGEMEHPRTLAHRLRDYAVGWLDPATNSKDRVVELVVLEQFLEALGPVLGLWVQRQGPGTLNEAVTMAERYQAAEPAPSTAPYKSAASAPALHNAPERVKGLGGAGRQPFRRAVAAGAPSPGIGTGWAAPRPIAVSGRGLGRPQHRRSPLIAPVFQPPAEASGRESSQPRCWMCHDLGHLARDCPAMERDLTGSESNVCSFVISGHRAVRLSGGSNLCFGRVEVVHGQSWGTVCDADFDWQDAEVVCRELQCGIPQKVLGAAHFKEGNGTLWSEEIQCFGNESRLYDCRTTDTKKQSCTHRNDVGLVCFGYTEYRLVGGPDSCSGRVELQYDGQWGTVCDRYWDLQDATVLCKQLNCGYAVSVPGQAWFGEGSGDVRADIFDCDGSETHISNCSISAWGQGACPHSNDAGVNCSGPLLPAQAGRVGPLPSKCNTSNEGTTLCSAAVIVLLMCACDSVPLDHTALRLVGGGGACAGRVEVYHNGSWGTVCDDSWDLADAEVVCKQLQCGTVLNASVSASFGQGTGPIWLDELRCQGNESTLWECDSGGWGQHNCRHKEDAGVVCSEFKDLRLAEGCSGPIEVLYNGTWRSVCSNRMTQITASVICQQLNCGESVAIRDAQSRLSSVYKWLDEVNCRRHDSTLWQCPSLPWGQTNCFNNEVAAIECTVKEKPPVTSIPKSCSEDLTQEHCTEPAELRLAGSSSPCSGRVEVRFEGSWGTVCGDSWDLKDAQVVCRQLGCGAAESTGGGEATFGQGNGTIWLDEVNCRGSEMHLWDCRHSPLRHNDCDHKEDAWVTCAEASPSRLQPQRDMTIPVTACIVLGALLFVVLVLLAGQLQHNRMLRRGREQIPLKRRELRKVTHSGPSALF
ncbi:scavenger receptor cysteine-rich type 1 protein M130-like [Acipenser ruthenus]|uniref:scavenger receptor cysteine-rich type 1 protein M130-like n=1 Tax=Acipenser ruthenus TaxID=7906 RepID=UPI0027429BCE|nr:scavenger receptor cysteine-rich type 1 protein M130-like [Acipenser ruthenus]